MLSKEDLEKMKSDIVESTKHFVEQSLDEIRSNRPVAKTS